MNIAFFAEPRTWAPLQGLLRWLAPAVAPLGQATPQPRTSPAARLDTLPACQRRLNRSDVAPSRLVQRRPLRVVRIMEAGQAPAQVGRMVISGRLADVCAELDRLAACEAASH
ncbi:hypothetical protein [Curvibacter delicatus]|jgi:hypothetical protein|uniref:hypothetical protein n=1 Tax=Curvibacter delicatus TaxID=80879 RepID=UPI00082EAE1E|nr:hypothetical protein [Curvibacter delicatus]